VCPKAIEKKGAYQPDWSVDSDALGTIWQTPPSYEHTTLPVWVETSTLSELAAAAALSSVVVAVVSASAERSSVTMGKHFLVRLQQ
jgi:hypothetical protein